MLVRFYPDEDDVSLESLSGSQGKGAVAREIKKLKARHKEIYLFVRHFLVNELANADGLQPYFDSDYAASLKGGLYELRIPPARKGGVFRIYFCFKDFRESSGVLVLLDAELKHKREAMRINSAREKLRQYKKWLGGKNE